MFGIDKRSLLILEPNESKAFTFASLLTRIVQYGIE
jgi:hypothetical protein